MNIPGNNGELPSENIAFAASLYPTDIVGSFGPTFIILLISLSALFLEKLAYDLEIAVALGIGALLDPAIRAVALRRRIGICAITERSLGVGEKSRGGMRRRPVG
jgi:hypothetical protein